MRELIEAFLPGARGARPEHVLGVAVAERRLHALLLECRAKETRVLRRFTRRRGGDYGSTYGEAGYDGYDDGGYGGDYGRGGEGFEEEDATGEDFTIQFGGEGGGNGNLFLQSEFGDLEDVGEEALGRGGTAATPGFPLALVDLLEECAEAGAPGPALAFSLAAADVTQVELVLPGEASPGKTSAAAVGRKALRAALADQYDGTVEKERVAFLPMTPSRKKEGAARFLALVGQASDPVLATLRTLQDQGEQMPGTGLLETEVSLYLGLARATLRAAEAEGDDALVVRVGAEDTLVLFVEGGVLRHTETLRSLTAQDAPDTICSRVLLLQDEYGIDDMEHVLLAGDRQREALREGFEMFFPEARVERLRHHLPVEASEEGEHGAAGVAAAAAALRLAAFPGYDGAFAEVDLLPPKLLRRRFRLPFSAAVPVMLLLMAGAGLFFGVRYQRMKGQQEAVRQRLAEYPGDAAEATPKALQARIDSVQGVSERYRKGLEALDRLLRGSDQWSHALAEISRETAAVNGIWVDQWTPQRSTVQLSGNATRRDRIVRLAERTEGQIKSVTFSEIRAWPVYSFTMDLPLKTGLPAATQYLREQARRQNAGGAVDPPPQGDSR